MDTTKSGNIENIAAPQAYPREQPPPYTGLEPGPSHPPYAGYSVTSQPQVTVVHPGSTTVIQGANVVPALIITNNMGPSPTTFVCRSCNQHIHTRVERIPSMRTHLFAALLCLIGCWPLVCLPYCVDSCNNADHYCPNCNAYIGTHKS